MESEVSRQVVLHISHIDEQFSNNYNRAKICLIQNYPEHYLPLTVSSGTLGFFWTSVLSLKYCYFICGNIHQGWQLRHSYYTEIHHSILMKGTSFPLSFSGHKPLVRNQCISRTAFLHSLILSILLLCLHTYVKNKITFVHMNVKGYLNMWG